MSRLILPYPYEVTRSRHHSSFRRYLYPRRMQTYQATVGETRASLNRVDTLSHGTDFLCAILTVSEQDVEMASRRGTTQRARAWVALRPIKPRHVEPFLRLAVRRIRATFPQVHRIVLFGSYATGKPTKDSDLDFFIVVPTRRRWSDRARQLHALFPERPLPMDFVVRTPEEVRERVTTYFCPFTREILTKGRVLYDASARRA